MTKLKLAILTVTMMLVASQVNAGDLWREYSHCCPGSFRHYILVWDGPWSESLIYMEDKHVDELFWEWEFFIGYLASSGVYSPAVPNRMYRMMAQPSGGAAYKDSQEVVIPAVICWENGN